MPELKPVYLVHGDDDAKIDEWRGRVRRRAEGEHGPGGLESFDAQSVAPEEVAAALLSLTFATGTRYLLVENAGSWKAAALEALTAVISSPPPDTVLVLIVRGKPLAGLVKAVSAAGGEVREHAAPKPWELPRWVGARAAEAGLRLDAEAARMLVALAGPGQQRLAREVEKLAIAVHPKTSAGAEEVELHAAGDGSAKVYDLADAVASGELEVALSLQEELAGRDERGGRLVYPVANRLREVHRVVELLDSGVAEKDLGKEMKVPPWRAKKAVAIARKADRETLRKAIVRFADLELELRNGSALDDETAVTMALSAAAA